MLAASQPSVLALASNPVTSEALTLTIYLDGFVLVKHDLIVNQTSPLINTTLLGKTHDELLIVDEQYLPLDYNLTENNVNIDSLGANQITISYFTADLTSKTGKYWTLTTTVSTNTTVTLPESASIISLNSVPELIETSNNQVYLVMPSGTIEITYIAEHSLNWQTQGIETWQLIAFALFPTTTAIVLILWLVKRNKTKQKKIQQSVAEVNVDKVFEREKHLRPEEVDVIHFLAEKHGTAFEAEIYEKLNLPRTTTWRLLRRLEKMEIVMVQKSRRQNIVSIRKKYLKK